MQNKLAPYCTRPPSKEQKQEFYRTLLPQAINLLSLTRGHDKTLGDFFADSREELIRKYDDVFNPIFPEPKDPTGQSGLRSSKQHSRKT